MNLSNIIHHALKKIIQSYRDNKCLIMTENDLVIRTYARLSEGGVPDVSLHSELRPYIGNDNLCCSVIRELTDDDCGKTTERFGWHTQGRANRGARFDLVVIQSDVERSKLWERALSKAKCDQGLSSRIGYWRILSYPLEGFKAVIEFKIRVKNNINNIMRDIAKLEKLHDENKNCLLYLVILDRCASEKDLEKIENRLKKTSVLNAYIVGSTHQLIYSPVGSSM